MGKWTRFEFGLETIMLYQTVHVKLADGWMDEWFDGSIEGWMVVGWVDGFKDGWMD